MTTAGARNALDRPSVSIHVAQSLDGRLALPGARALLSSPEGMVLAHRARAENDAVLIGSVTARTDDPRLTVRACEGPEPRRIVLSSALEVSPTARLFEPGPGVMLIGVEGRASRAAIERVECAGAEVRLVRPDDAGLVSLTAALEAIRAWGIERLLVEGGARIVTAFLRERLVDSMTIEIAPCLLGAPGLSTVNGLGVAAAEQALRLADVRVESAGPSVVVRGRLAR